MAERAKKSKGFFISGKNMADYYNGVKDQRKATLKEKVHNEYFRA